MLVIIKHIYNWCTHRAQGTIYTCASYQEALGMSEGFWVYGLNYGTLNNQIDVYVCWHLQIQLIIYVCVIKGHLKHKIR